MFLRYDSLEEIIKIIENGTVTKAEIPGVKAYRVKDIIRIDIDSPQHIESL